MKTVAEAASRLRPFKTILAATSAFFLRGLFLCCFFRWFAGFLLSRLLRCFFCFLFRRSFLFCRSFFLCWGFLLCRSFLPGGRGLTSAGSARHGFRRRSWRFRFRGSHVLAHTWFLILFFLFLKIFFQRFAIGAAVAIFIHFIIPTVKGQIVEAHVSS